MIANPCFRKSFAMVLILNLLILPLSCVNNKDVRISKEEISSEAYSEKDMSAAIKIRPIPQQSVNIPEKGPLIITVKDAILLSLENNRSLSVERINPSIRKTFEDEERAVFDPTVEAEVSDQRNDIKSLNQSGRYTINSVNDVIQGSLSLKEYFPTGTFVEVDAVTKTTDSDLYNDTYSSTRLGLSVTQSASGLRTECESGEASSISTRNRHYPIRASGI